MKVIRKTCKQTLGDDDVLKEQVEWMKKAMFPNNTDPIFPNNTNPEEAIKRLQEISDNLEFFKSGMWVNSFVSFLLASVTLIVIFVFIENNSFFF